MGNCMGKERLGDWISASGGRRGLETPSVLVRTYFRALYACIVSVTVLWSPRWRLQCCIAAHAWSCEAAVLVSLGWI